MVKGHLHSYYMFMHSAVLATKIQTEFTTLKLVSKHISFHSKTSRFWITSFPVPLGACIFIYILSTIEPTQTDEINYKKTNKQKKNPQQKLFSINDANH
uniref:Uncharacterized protein n=1 Tax=Anguilla anguilla TaxID=7936 RepID=A0A0E9WPK4_ANGAN